MNNLQSYKQSGCDVIKWATGLNNFRAINAVVSGKYDYYDVESNVTLGMASRTTRLKQIGTEILHAGLKYASVGYGVDQGIAAAGGTPFILEAAKDTAASLASVVYSYSVPMLPYMYAGYNAYTHLKEGKGWTKFTNAGLGIPLVLCAMNTEYGNYAAAGLLTVNHIVDYKMVTKYGKWGEAAVKAAFVAGLYYAAYGSPI